MRRAFPGRARPVVRHSDSDRGFEFDPDSGFARHTDFVGDADSHVYLGFDADPHADPDPDADVDADFDFAGDATPTYFSDSDSDSDFDFDADTAIESDPDENLSRHATVVAYTSSTFDVSVSPAHTHPGRDLGYACHVPAARTAVGVTGRGIPRNFGRQHLGRQHLGRHATPAASTEPARST